MILVVAVGHLRIILFHCQALEDIIAALHADEGLCDAEGPAQLGQLQMRYSTSCHTYIHLVD